jgi:NTP pyrophosphatase (non-canonical NTP hydrolase)
MGYGTDGLTFRTLRDGNVERLPLFKDKKGRRCHPRIPSQRPGSNWSAAQWLQAIVGELGEYANLRKKVERGDFTEAEAKEMLKAEIADVVIYIDLLAHNLGIDLGEAVMSTWNAKSEALGIPIYLDAEDWHFSRALTNEEQEAAGRKASK